MVKGRAVDQRPLSSTNNNKQTAKTKTNQPTQQTVCTIVVSANGFDVFFESLGFGKFRDIAFTLNKKKNARDKINKAKKTTRE